jgi:cobalt/nickel transport system permease protein
MTLAFDPLLAADSPFARLDPRWKLAALGSAVLAVALVRSLAPAAVALAAALLLVALARLPGRWVLRRCGALLLSLAPLLLFLPLAQGGGPARAALIAAKALASVFLVLVVLGTAPLSETLHAAQALRVPGLLVQLLLLSYRYTFVLADELQRLRRALRLRGFRARMTPHGYRTAGHVVGTLLVRGAERAEGVAVAMRCRGFDGRFRSLARFHTTAADVAFFALVAAAGAVVVAWDAFQY